MNKRLIGGTLAVLAVATMAFFYLNAPNVADPGASVAKLEWTTPTERVDDTPVEAISGYRIYYGRDPEQLEHEIEVGPEVTKYRFDNLEAGDWYFAVSATCEKGIESAPSSIMRKAIEEPPPRMLLTARSGIVR